MAQARVATLLLLVAAAAFAATALAQDAETGVSSKPVTLQPSQRPHSCLSTRKQTLDRLTRAQHEPPPSGGAGSGGPAAKAGSCDRTQRRAREDRVSLGAGCRGARAQRFLRGHLLCSTVCARPGPTPVFVAMYGTGRLFISPLLCELLLC